MNITEAKVVTFSSSKVMLFILYVFLYTCKFVMPRSTPRTVIVSHGFIASKSARELSTKVVAIFAFLFSAIYLLAASFQEPILPIVELSSFASRVPIFDIEVASLAGEYHPVYCIYTLLTASIISSSLVIFCTSYQKSRVCVAVTGFVLKDTVPSDSIK